MKLNNIDSIKIINLEHIITDKTNMYILDRIEKLMKIKRIFFISSSQEKAKKGFHAHKIDNQIISCVYGQIQLTIKDGKSKKVINIKNPKKFVYVPVHLWTETKYLIKNSVVCVFSSSYYNEKSYIRNFNDYLEFRKN
tara:strand:- start:18324 stop:18737 length:414 start_codon:yes stop_codon:yes gene_type:complete